MSRDIAQDTAQLCGAALSWKKWSMTFAVLLLSAASLAAQPLGRQNRISPDFSARPNVELSGTVHPLIAKATDLGAVNSSLQLDSMTLNIAASSAQKKEIAALQVAQQDSKSPQYHKWLTQAEYGALFGLTDADLAQLTSWLKSQGFAVKSVSTSRNAISFSGKAWQVESAFHTQLHQYKLDGETHFANASALRLPAQFESVVLNVRGLDDFRPKPNLKRTPVALNYTYNAGIHYLSPADWATIYNVNAIYSAGFDGTGTHVGVVGQTYAPQSDIDKFRHAAGLPATQLTYYCISTADCTTTAGINTGDLGEADLDIEWAGGIAKNAMVDYIYASGSDVNLGVFNALQYAIETYKTADGSVLPVISMSYSSCEALFPPADFALIDDMGKQASTQGQTLVVSSGDSGAAGCDPHSDPLNLVATLGLAVNVPADSPNFTAVGGTAFSGDVSNAAPYWRPTVGLVNSAIQYIPEISWNETNLSGIATSGGGESTATTVPGNQLVFPQPLWQNALVPSTTGRLVPDVAFAAGVGHDGYLLCSSDFDSAKYGTMCVNSFYSSGGTGGSTLYAAGGTSASTPSFAGMLTLLVQRYGPLGNINPVFYPLAANTSIFHDIKDGDSKVACTAGTKGCVGGYIGYTATAGYDQVTGLGSIDGGGLYGALSSTYTKATTNTVVAIAPNPVASGNTVTITATVSSPIAGVETGTVTFKTAAATLGSGLVTAGGLATLNVPTTTANGLGLGSDKIIATYGGDTNYLASAGSTLLTVTPPLVLTTTTASASPSSLTMGGTTTLAATVTPIGITGTVTFKVGNTIIGAPATISGGIATLSNVTVSTANGFSVGSDSITAIFSGDASFAPSTSLSTTLTVNAAALGVTTTTALTTPSSLAIGATTNLSASVASTTVGTITGTVTFQVGNTIIGTPAAISGGIATLSNVTVNTANGFSVGSDSITATYSGDANFASSISPSTILTVNAAVVPSYTLSASSSGVTGSSNVTLTLTSTNYAGTVSFGTSVSSTNGTATNISVSAPSVLMTSGATGTSILTITSGANATTHAPPSPWKSGGAVVFCVVLLSAPFGVRRKRVMATLLTAVAISLAGFLMACGGFFVETGSSAKSARVYTVTVTPTGTPTLVTNPVPVTITVTVP